jgi:hypothetical protein
MRTALQNLRSGEPDLYRAQGRARFLPVGVDICGGVVRATSQATDDNTYGWHEGRNPNAYFDTAGHLAHYADVAAPGVNPLQHDDA